MPVFRDWKLHNVLSIKAMGTVDPTNGTIGPYSIATASAKEAVLVANTPSFLLDRLRKDISVQTLVSSVNSADILRALSESLAKPLTDVAQIVTAYIFLVALSGSDPQDQELWRQISSLDLSSLEWGNAIRELMLAEAVPTNTLTIPSDMLQP